MIWKLLLKELSFLIRKRYDFHGGEFPDMADIKLYSTIQSKNKSVTWREFLDHELNQKFKKWYLSMGYACKNKD